MAHSKEGREFHSSAGLASSALTNLPSTASPVAVRAVGKKKRTKRTKSTLPNSIV